MSRFAQVVCKKCKRKEIVYKGEAHVCCKCGKDEQVLSLDDIKDPAAILEITDLELEHDTRIMVNPRSLWKVFEKYIPKKDQLKAAKKFHSVLTESI